MRLRRGVSPRRFMGKTSIELPAVVIVRPSSLSLQALLAFSAAVALATVLAGPVNGLFALAWIYPYMNRIAYLRWRNGKVEVWGLLSKSDLYSILSRLKPMKGRKNESA